MRLRLDDQLLFLPRVRKREHTHAIDEDDIIYLTAASESSSSACVEEEESNSSSVCVENEESSSSVCSDLSVDCLKGSWTFSHFFDAESPPYTEPNALTFNSCQQFIYMPNSDDANHTYCVGDTLFVPNDEGSVTEVYVKD